MHHSHRGSDHDRKFGRVAFGEVRWVPPIDGPRVEQLEIGASEAVLVACGEQALEADEVMASRHLDAPQDQERLERLLRREVGVAAATRSGTSSWAAMTAAARSSSCASRRHRSATASGGGALMDHSPLPGRPVARRTVDIRARFELRDRRDQHVDRDWRVDRGADLTHQSSSRPQVAVVEEQEQVDIATGRLLTARDGPEQDHPRRTERRHDVVDRLVHPVAQRTTVPQAVNVSGLLAHADSLRIDQDAGPDTRPTRRGGRRPHRALASRFPTR